MIVNNSKYEWKQVGRARVNANGEFRIPFVAGEEYLIGVDDYEFLRNKGTSPKLVKVEPGQFVEVTIEYPKILAPGYSPKS